LTCFGSALVVKNHNLPVVSAHNSHQASLFARPFFRGTAKFNFGAANPTPT